MRPAQERGEDAGELPLRLLGPAPAYRGEVDEIAPVLGHLELCAYRPAPDDRVQTSQLVLGQSPALRNGRGELAQERPQPVEPPPLRRRERTLDVTVVQEAKEWPVVFLRNGLL